MAWPPISRGARPRGKGLFPSVAVGLLVSCSSPQITTTPKFLQPLKGFEGLVVEATYDDKGFVCLALSLGTAELKSGCQSGLKPTVYNVGAGNFHTASDRAPGGTTFSLFALDFDDIAYRFEDVTDSGTVATSGPGYLLVLTPGPAAMNAAWKVWVHGGDGRNLMCAADFGPLRCSLDQ